MNDSIEPDDEHPYCEMCETNIPLDSPKWDSRFEEPICVDCGETIPDPDNDNEGE